MSIELEMSKFEKEISGMPAPSSKDLPFMPPQLRKGGGPMPPPLHPPPRIPHGVMPPPYEAGPVHPAGRGPIPKFGGGMPKFPAGVAPRDAAKMLIEESRKKSNLTMGQQKTVFESPSVTYVGASLRKMRAEVRAERRQKRKEENEKFFEAKRMRDAGIEPPKAETKPVAMELEDPNQKEQGPSMPAGMIRKQQHQRKKRLIRTAAGEVWEDPTLMEWSFDDFRMFCGDLGNEVTDEVLARAFSQYPSFQKAKVVRDRKTNKTKGYGFVSFRDADDFMRAMREMNGKYVGNRPIKLRKSNWKDRNLDEVHRKLKEKRKLGFR